MVARDKKGRSVKQRLAPGAQDGIKTVYSPEKIEQVLEKLHSLALQGDKRAGDLYLSYAIGKPVPSTEAQTRLTWKEAVEQILNGEDPEGSAG